MTATVIPPRARLAGLDRLRGVAVMLMVADHCLLVGGAHLWRLGVTRAALPLFALIAGSLVGEGGVRSRRLWAVEAVGLLVAAPEAALGIAFPGVLLLLAVGVVVAGETWGRPTLRLGVLAACMVQPLTWPVGSGGYEPGLVVGLVLLGQGHASRLDRWGARLPGWFAAAGRYPLTAYAVHVTALAAAVLVGGVGR